MNKEIIFNMNTAFRGEYTILGYRFGHGEKAACIIGAMRGNEFQQLYMCSQLIAKLEQLESKGAIVANKEILIIPSLNYNSMNVGKKFWVSDSTDINRSFPGNPEGPATSRIAAAVLERVKDYSYGIQFASFYMGGEFIPHIRLTEEGVQNTSLANLFGMPYVLTASERAFDTTTLAYNWQKMGTSAFSLYTGATERIDEERARQGVSAILRFLTRMGIIRYNCHGGYISTIIEEDDLLSIRADMPGFFRPKVSTNTEVVRGQLLAEVVDSFRGDVISRMVAPTDGIIFYQQIQPMVFQNSVAFKMIKRIHE
ncbi:MAG: succinylglutamate desuccinylase/aspartoacylase family protein [Lachnospiraceae bacterium]|nr:succinylglutamate desuccinylase/aspartoacylase family protein [Lachnospiraceae bacterium]MBP3507704.1 succinylglutamate desuccinylase/aspartoacylase family protein [Lachnospiraceae bacterium]